MIRRGWIRRQLGSGNRQQTETEFWRGTRESVDDSGHDEGSFEPAKTQQAGRYNSPNFLARGNQEIKDRRLSRRSRWISRVAVVASRVAAASFLGLAGGSRGPPVSCLGFLDQRLKRKSKTQPPGASFQKEAWPAAWGSKPN